MAHDENAASSLRSESDVPRQSQMEPLISSIEAIAIVGIWTRLSRSFWMQAAFPRGACQIATAKDSGANDANGKGHNIKP